MGETTSQAWIDTFSKSGVENLAQDATFTEKLLYGLKYAAVGILTVFMVLVIIMAVLYLFKLFSRGEKKPSVQASKPAVNSAPAVNANVAAAADKDEEELAATAAIAAYLGKSDCAFKIISVTKIK